MPELPEVETIKVGLSKKIINQSCQICATTIQKIMLGGRGTYFCPQCQRI